MLSLPELTSHIHDFLSTRGIFTLLKKEAYPHLEGVWGAGAAAVLAAVLEENPGKNLVVLTSTQKAALDFQDDLPLFSERPTLFFPWLNDLTEMMAVRDDSEDGESENSKDSEDSNDEILKTFIPDASVGERIRVLKSFLRTRNGEETAPPVVVAPIQSLLMPCPSPEVLEADSLRLRAGETVTMDSITEWLVTHGFQNVSAVEFPGEFFVRGGLIDIYALDWERPLRIEFFGDEIDSIREFDLETQRSLRTLPEIDVAAFTTVLHLDSGRAALTDYLTEENTLFFLLEPEDIQLQGRRFHQAQESPERLFTTEEVLRSVMKFPFMSASALGSGAFGENVHLAMESVERFSGDFSRVKEELLRFGVGQTIYLLCPNDAEIKRLTTIFSDTVLAKKRMINYRIGMISEGFRFVSSHEMVISSSALFNRSEIRRSAIENKNRAISGTEAGQKSGVPGPMTKAIDAFTDLQEGDYVVHVSFGIARYRGLKLLEPLKSKGGALAPASASRTPNAGGAEEHMVLEFRDKVFVYVPVSKIALVQKYICGGNAAPRLSTYGGKTWQRMKQAVEDSIQDLASDMLNIQALRQTKPGISFPIDTPLQKEFDSLFPFTETPDQLKAIDAIRADMASPRPMDRLLCGDVGFGKTEMAMRAAFTAVEAGYQVGIMAPTTVLVEQHLRTFSQRMATFPVHIEAISRFSSAAEQKEIIRRTAEGKVDILIGTHRIASSDVKFRNLGLIIIDEEQLFGVEMKESLKRLRTIVDVLTMTATPIPRTLHMSLLGIRDISSLETPPADRRAIETHITRFQDSLVRNAILRELDRNGQVFFVHNRVYDIQEVADRLKALVPEARIAVGHAQMPEHQLEKVMISFVNHEVDVLLSTTIIGSGMDIPNANTIFIDDANRYGLAAMHQLRGRVGRFKNHAYCYLLVNPQANLTETALRRLKAIEEFAHLGSGFNIAMRDLEIRGAGNILGTMQSGQIAMVGYELYCDLLEATVRQMKRLPPRETVEVDVRIPLTAYIPHQYVSEMRVKMELYRRLSRLTRPEHVDDFEAELKDRFGKIPPQTQLLLKLYRVRILAHQWLIHAIYRNEEFLVFEFFSKKALEPVAGRRIGPEGKTLRFADDHSAYLPLDEAAQKAGPDSEILLNYVEMLLRET